MPIMAVREFECIVCRTQFTALTQDLVPPWTLICDACMETLLALEGEALAAHLAAAHQAGEPARPGEPTTVPAQRHPFEKEIIAHVQRAKQHRGDRDVAV